MQAQKPVVALVGRPNVGKSTLFNRLIGRPTAIVEDVPGTTRDRIYGESDWNGVGFIVIDTGGLETPETMRTGRQTEAPPTADAASSPQGFTNFVQNQAQVAIAEADAIVLLVDGRSGLTAADEDVAEVLRRSDKPVFIAVNKAENQRVQQNAVDFWSLGLGEPYPISAYHGDGVADMLDELVKVLSPYPVDEEEEKTIGIAIVGRPNVGKSSLLNVLVGHERAIVSEVPGTTRDPIDMQITYDGERITLIDTAGIRRRGRVEQGIEQYSVLRSMRAIDRADVALLLIDAQEGVTMQDMHVAGYVLERNKSVVVLINKWDAIEKDSQTMVEYAKTVRDQLAFLDYVPVLFISAKTRQRVNRVLPAALQVVAARRHRLSTSEVNQVLTEAYEAVQIPMRHGRTLRLYYGTQVGNEPPTFVIFVNHEELVHFSYSRYLENRIRAYYPFEGTPIKLLFRSRDRNEK
ncbi:ribosome biogenesis GTPase Der [Caldilinea sp.]|uniref:ribosome biogenesis GTPase Der n=1 Tax=Caldilinea sp. TaxID=2293560 RepID=UPI002B6581DD|nr:ribosome biogenesis GTPase Der [Anaerolineales bacterium]HQY93083.1 ribosome biogenesis GTPase Der [Caldilinea sp.]HRA66587.1 ribosome biogenesis GTPase Der [Caldilinea sp.]